MYEDLNSKLEYQKSETNVINNDIAQIKSLLYSLANRIGSLEDYVNKNNVEYNTDPEQVNFDPTTEYDEHGSTAEEGSANNVYTITITGEVWDGSYTCYFTGPTEGYGNALSVVSIYGDIIGQTFLGFLVPNTEDYFQFDVPRWL